MDPRTLLRQYAAAVAATDEPDTWHVLGMLVKMQEMLACGENLKFCRWLGYAQRWLEEKGLRTLDQLRDETRNIDDALAVAQAPGTPQLSPDTLARIAYEAYASDHGWTTEEGTQMPIWGTLRLGERSHWLAAGDAVAAALGSPSK